MFFFFLQNVTKLSVREVYGVRQSRSYIFFFFLKVKKLLVFLRVGISSNGEASVIQSVALNSTVQCVCWHFPVMSIVDYFSLNKCLTLLGCRNWGERLLPGEGPQQPGEQDGDRR